MILRRNIFITQPQKQSFLEYKAEGQEKIADIDKEVVMLCNIKRVEIMNMKNFKVTVTSDDVHDIIGIHNMKSRVTFIVVSVDRAAYYKGFGC